MRVATQESYRERVLAVLLYIQEHLEEPLELAELARVACFSPFHFHRIFRGIVGEPVKEHIRRLRLERAASRLKSGAQPVTRIALDAGYESPEAFTRAFHSLFGCSPSDYRSSRPKPLLKRALGGRSMEVRLEQMPALRVAFIRYVGPFETVGVAWGRLTMWAGPRGLIGPATRFLCVWLDDPEVTAPEKLRGDVCVTVSEAVPPEGEIGVRELPGGEYAVATHRGPYGLLGETYARLCGQWAPAAGRELRDAPAFEVYLNDPRATPETELLTEVYLPLA